MEHADRALDLPMLRRAALTYVQRGWRVLPLWWPAATGCCACGAPDCASIGKHPIPHLVPHGLHDAVTDPATVESWWCAVPNANVGVRTGGESRLVVLDVDGLAGARALRSLVAHRPIEAAWVQTGDGWHAYFAHPGPAVRSSAGQIGDGLDVRADSSYVVAPPSRHRSGRAYRWIVLPDHVAELAPMPAWLLQLAVPAQTAVGRSDVSLRTGDAHAYVVAAVASEARKVAQAPRGQRNHRLNLAAFRLGQLVGAGLLEEATATAALVDAGMAAGPGERKIRSTVRRGLQAGRRHPRRMLPRDSP
jgi:Bifunctional DNA primase/polymerase, N-terminal